jgi:hypothetical protein
LAAALASCSPAPGLQEVKVTASGANVSSAGSVTEVLADSLATHWQPEDADYSEAQQIDLADGPATISQPGAYRLSGKLADGQIRVEVEQKGLVQLVLDGAHVTSETSSALYVASADEVAVILADGSDNSLADAASYEQAEDEPDAALFSKADLSIAGQGRLTVTGRAGDAIASKDGLVIAGGEVTVVAADDAIKGRDYLRLAGGTVTLEAGGDGLKATNAEDPGAGYVLFEGGAALIEAAADCVDAATHALIAAGSAELSCGDDAIHGEVSLVADGGQVAVRRSYEGLEAPVVKLAGGDFDIVASDDAVNAAASTDQASSGEAGDWPGGGAGRGQAGGAMGVQDGVELSISGGSFMLRAGSDGIDANGAGVISGGTVTVYAEANGMEGPFDIAEAGPTITGGTVIAYGLAGRQGSILSPAADSTQGWIAAALGSGAAAGQPISLAAADGRELAQLTPDEAVVSLVYSAPELVTGDSYTVAAGGDEVTVTAGQGSSGAAGGFGQRGGSERGRRGQGGQGGPGAGQPGPAAPTQAPGDEV